MKRSEIQIRDPFVYADDSAGIYHLYGTNFHDGKAFYGFDCYTSSDLENFDGPFPVFRPTQDFWANLPEFWAPELHFHCGKFFLFATFHSSHHARGTQILESASPLGPFIPISDGPVTPSHMECLDGTLYVAPDGVPWIVFCHEWLQIVDGTICAMPLSDDLSMAAGSPEVLFAASDAPWTRPIRADGSRVTDGPFLIRHNKKLCMIWSSFGEKGYAMGAAVSLSGKITGPWKNRTEPIFADNGGHGMIFRDFAGNMRMTVHMPNSAPERPLFMPFPKGQLDSLTNF